MKKICYVTTVSSTLQAFVLPLVEYIIRNTDWEITLICDDDDTFSKSLPEKIRYIPVTMKRGINLSGICAIMRMAKIFREEKFDLIQYSTPNAAFYASIAAKWAGIKLRKYHLMGFRYLGFRGLPKLIFKTIEKIACGLSTDVECVSQSNMELGIRERIFSREAAHVIYCGSSSGIDLGLYDISQRDVWRKELRNQYGIDEKDVVFGFAGRITRDKGINELLQAFFQLPVSHKKLALIGRFEQEGSLNPKLLSEARARADVIFIPSVQDIQRYYTMMDVLLLPSYREGFGNIVIEAQAMGTPVIVSDIPGPVDAMGPDITGLVVPVRDANALCSAMEKMASDTALIARMGAAGRQLVEERFDQKILFQHILEDRKRILCE